MDRPKHVRRPTAVLYRRLAAMWETELRALGLLEKDETVDNMTMAEFAAED